MKRLDQVTDQDLREFHEEMMGDSYEHDPYDDNDDNELERKLYGERYRHPNRQEQRRTKVKTAHRPYDR